MTMGYAFSSLGCAIFRDRGEFIIKSDLPSRSMVPTEVNPTIVLSACCYMTA